MEQIDDQEQGKKKVYDVKIFPVPFALEEIKENINITTNNSSQPSKQEIINQAFQFHSQGNVEKAIKYYQLFINQGFKDHRVFSNYGVILRDLGKLKEAEFSTRKAIELDPDDAKAHYNLGNIFNDLGKLEEAEVSTRKAIKLDPDFANGYLNLGSILKNHGKLEEAEVSTRKAIELDPNDANAHYNLGNILSHLGKLEEAEFSTRKAIELNPNFAKAYYSLSLLRYSDKNKIWQDQLFSESVLKNKSEKDQVDIYFARANILHKNKNFKESSKYFQLANKLKLNLNQSNSDLLINKSITLLMESDKTEIIQQEDTQSPESIFIVGMPRSGSTLLESILSMNKSVDDLGESNILEESYKDWERNTKKLTLSKIYFKKIIVHNSKLNIITNKTLYNYQYAGFIAKKLPNAKIIHSYRNPLDNILSIYRAHFASGNEYSSSLVDSARVYLDQEEIMTEYKNRFRSKIYDLNYDLLVSNPIQEIKSLISWLGWRWDDKYLSPHLNPRSVLTRSNIEVRSPINSKSIDGWKNYKDMLKPAIEILTQSNRYRDLI